VQANNPDGNLEARALISESPVSLIAMGRLQPLLEARSAVQNGYWVGCRASGEKTIYHVMDIKSTFLTKPSLTLLNYVHGFLLVLLGSCSLFSFPLLAEFDMLSRDAHRNGSLGLQQQASKTTSSCRLQGLHTKPHATLSPPKLNPNPTALHLFISTHIQSQLSTPSPTFQIYRSSTHTRPPTTSS